MRPPSRARLQGRALEHGLVSLLSGGRPPSAIRMREDGGVRWVEITDGAGPVLSAMRHVAENLLRSLREEVYGKGSTIFADQTVVRPGEIRHSVDLRIRGCTADPSQWAWF